jgi:pimeloyl-ACP methyl ester carboxylesterase
MSLSSASTVRHFRVQSGPVSLAVQSRGDAAHPCLIFIHGYPDTSALWDAIAAPLADRFHVVTYDVRGAGASEAPQGINPYQFQYLIADLAAVADAVSPNKPVHLIGSDWGSLQGWKAVESPLMAGRIASFSTAAPSLDHVGVWFQRRLQGGSLQGMLQAGKQMLGSLYMGAFQLPVVPELTWRLAMPRLWPWFLKTAEGVNTAPEATLVADGVQGLGLYRANLTQALIKPEPRVTHTPVQLLVQMQDRFVPAHLLDGLAEWVPNLTRRELATGHWGAMTHPELFVEPIATFVSQLESAHVSY